VWVWGNAAGVCQCTYPGYISRGYVLTSQNHKHAAELFLVNHLPDKAHNANQALDSVKCNTTLTHCTLFDILYQYHYFAWLLYATLHITPPPQKISPQVFCPCLKLNIDKCDNGILMKRAASFASSHFVSVSSINYLQAVGLSVRQTYGADWLPSRRVLCTSTCLRTLHRSRLHDAR